MISFTNSSSRSCQGQVFREMYSSMDATVSILDEYRQNGEVIDSLMIILRFESGIDAQSDNLKHRCLDTIQVIDQVR